MGLQLYQKNLLEKLKESLGAVLPIIGIVLVLCFSIAPIPNSVLMTFVVGAVLLIIGMMFFTLGAEMAMTPMGERIGTKLTNTRKISVVIVLCFILGFIITISEPDLQVLASQLHADYCSSNRSWNISCSRSTSNVIWNSTGTYAFNFVPDHIHFGKHCSTRFSDSGI